MNTTIKVALVVASLAGAGAVGLAIAHPGGQGYGPGMMGQGYGPGAGQMGQGHGPGMMGQGYGPGAGQMGQGHGPGMMGQGYGPGAGQMGQGHGPGMMGQGMQGPDPAARLDWMKGQLGITTDQEAAWKAFADQAQAQMASREGHRQAMFEMHKVSGEQQNPAERMQARIGLMEGRLAQMRAMSAAMDTLYQALTPEQQASAAQLMNRAGAGHHGR